MHDAPSSNAKDNTVKQLNFTKKIDINNNLYVKAYFGDELKILLDSKKNEIANCYRDVFNESWGEDWTTESALDEIVSNLTHTTDRNPVATFLFYKGVIVGFSWGAIMSCESLRIHGDMPHSLSYRSKSDGYKVAQYWMSTVVAKKKIFSWREIGVLKNYRKNVYHFLSLPLFQIVTQQGCDVTLGWTQVSCSAFKLHLGVGLYPIHFFITDDLTLISGNVKKIKALLEKRVFEYDSLTSSRKAINKIQSYLCV